MFNLNLKIFIFGLVLSGLIFIFKSAEASVVFFAGVTLAMASILAYSDISSTLLRTSNRILMPVFLLVFKFSVLIFLISSLGSNTAMMLWLVSGLMSFIPVAFFKSTSH